MKVTAFLLVSVIASLLGGALIYIVWNLALSSLFDMQSIPFVAAIMLSFCLGMINSVLQLLASSSK